VGDRDYNDTRYIQSAFLDAFLPINGLVLFVNAEFPSQVTGKRYQTIQAAINYAQSQGPTASSQWLIIIFDKKDTVGYAENITLQPYIHLAGWGKTVRVYGTMGGMSSNTRLYNIQWTSLGNFSVSNIRAKECSFITDDPQATGFDITLTGTTTKNCYLHATQNVLSGGSNNYLNLATSAGFEPQTTDKGSHFSLNLPQFSGNPFDI
jgi:hypothetical protein